VRIVVLALVTAFAVAFAGTARADDDLAEAKRLESQLEYDKALVIIEKLIAQGGLDRDHLVQLHLFAGKLAAGLDRTDVAEEHFARVLTLAPALTLPEGTSPKITAPFDAARGRTTPLRISTRRAGDHMEAVIEADPLQIVARQERVAISDGGFDLRALDVYGNVVWTEHEHGEQTSLPPVHITPPHRPFYKRSLFWGSVFVGTAALSGVAAWRFEVAQNDWNQMKADGSHDYTDGHERQPRRRRAVRDRDAFLLRPILTSATIAIAIGAKPRPSLLPASRLHAGRSPMSVSPAEPLPPLPPPPGPGTVTVAIAVEECPAASVAVATSVCVPAPAAVAFQSN
jgi:hypothetical protein